MKNFKSFLFILFFLLIPFTLSACQNSSVPTEIKDIPVELSQEAEQALNKQVEELTTLLAQQKLENKVDHLKVIELARAYEDLGQLSKAIALYEDYIKDHSEIAVISNLGLLYKTTGQNEKAIEQYQRLVDEFKKDNYLNDIARLYIQKNDLKKAEKAYEAWKKATGEKDELTEQIINSLK